MAESTQLTQSKYVHQLNTYYGVFYPAELDHIVTDMIRKGTKYHDLLKEDREADCGKAVLFMSSNSDVENVPTIRFIAIDNLTVEGDEYDLPGEIDAPIEPSEMIKLEKQFAGALSAITDFYNNIRKEFRAAKVTKEQLEDLKVGWRAVACTWLDDGTSEEDEESSEEVVKIVKKPKKKTTERKSRS